jgi:hypothetical protein
VVIDAGFGAGEFFASAERTIRPEDRIPFQESHFQNEEDRRRFINDLRIGAISILHAPERW